MDEKPVAGITSFLTEPGTVEGKPFRLKANEGKSFIGSYVLGMDFVLSPDEAEQLIDKDPRNKDVLFPYLNGEDLNSRPDQSPSRWVINFFDWPLDRDSAQVDYEGPVAANYPDCLTIIEEKVEPERVSKQKNPTDRDRAKHWWRSGRRASELYRTVAGMRRPDPSLTSKYHNLIFVGQGIVASHMTVVLPLESWEDYCLLQSEQHWKWALEYGNKLETRPVAPPSDCLETFPFLQLKTGLGPIGKAYYEHRLRIMTSRGEGITLTYNRFHDRDEDSVDIQKLHNLHIRDGQGSLRGLRLVRSRPRPRLPRKSTATLPAGCAPAGGDRAERPVNDWISPPRLRRRSHRLGGSGRRRCTVLLRAALRRDSSIRCCSTCSGWFTAHRSGSNGSSSVSPALKCSKTSRTYAHGSRQCRITKGPRKPPSQPSPFSPRKGDVPPSGQLESGPVIRGKDNDCVFGDAEFIEFAQKFTDDPIQLLHAVGIAAEFGFVSPTL